MYSIHRRNVGASLIKINEGMSELLDKQVDTENKNLKIKIPSPRKVCNENKRKWKKKRLPRKNFLLKGGLYRTVSEEWLNQFR